MKKILSVFINFSLVIFFCLLPALNSGAVSVDSENIINSVSEALIPEDIENIPDESYKNAEIFGEELSFENTSSFFDVGKIVSFIFGILTSVLATKKSYIMTLISILTLSFIAQYLGQGLANEKTLSSIRKITVLLTAVSVFFPLWETISDSLTYGETLSSFSVSIMPIFVSLASASGTPSAAVGSSAAVFFSVEFFSWVLAVAVPVFVSVFLSAGIASGFSEDEGLKKLSSAARNIIIAVMTFVYFLISTVASLQGGILSGTDTVAKKGLKFVVGSAVPVAGGFLSDGLDSVYASASALSKTLGGFSVVVIFLAAVTPLIELLVCGLCMKACAVISSLFKNSPLENFFAVSFDAYLVALSFVLGYFVTLSILMLITVGG